MANSYLQLLYNEMLNVSNQCYSKACVYGSPYDEWAIEARAFHDVAMRLKAMANESDCSDLHPFDPKFKE